MEEEDEEEEEEKKKGKTQEKMERGSRKKSCSTGERR
jgi:hypothetical protein